MGYFFMFFALFWGGLPSFIVIPQIITGEAPLETLPFILIFTVVGTGMFIFGLKSVLKDRRLKKLAKTGKDATGTFVTYTLTHTTNGVPYFKVVFTYENDKGEIVEAHTAGKYRTEEAEYYSHVGKFQIKYDNKDAVIVQKVDYKYLNDFQLLKMQQSGSYFQTHYDNPRYPKSAQAAYGIQQQKEVFYKCDYCGCSQAKPGKCQYCGANVHKKHTK